MTTQKMIELENIHKTYRTGGTPLHVIKGIELAIGRGELASIMGASGSGKSTLMNVIGLLDSYDEGSYRLDGELMKNLSEAAAARHRSRSIGFVFQSFHLIQFKTAVENVALPLYYQRVGRRERNEIAREYLDKVGLSDRGHHLPRELSGGQQQRVAIARALIAKPKVLLADEPTGALDSTTSREVMRVLQHVRDEGVTVIIITHEHSISDMTDRVIHLVDGRITDDSRRVAVRADVPAEAASEALEPTEPMIRAALADALGEVAPAEAAG